MNTSRNRYHIYSAILMVSMGARGQTPAGGTYEVQSVGTQPAAVSEGQNFELVLSGYNLNHLGIGGSGAATVEGDIIWVNRVDIPCFSVPYPPPPANEHPSVAAVPISGLPSGTYRVAGEWGNTCQNQAASIETEIVIYPNSETPKFNHESPASGQVVSGVGVIRGWACYYRGKGQIGKVTFTIDENEFHFPLPHGSVREDTWEVCDYGLQNGYGGVVYWPIIGNSGDHTLTIYIDGEEVDSVRFTIAEPPRTSVPEDIGFRKGAEGEYVIDGFLGTQESVTIQWSEADQNFIIIEYN